MQTYEDIELAGIMSLLYGMLLHNVPTRGETPTPPELSPNTLTVTLVGLKLINQLATMDYKLIQVAFRLQNLWLCLCEMIMIQLTYLLLIPWDFPLRTLMRNDVTWFQPAHCMSLGKTKAFIMIRFTGYRTNYTPHVGRAHHYTGLISAKFNQIELIFLFFTMHSYLLSNWKIQLITWAGSYLHIHHSPNLASICLNLDMILCI